MFDVFPSWFMVPMGARDGVQSTHELVRSPGFSRSRPTEGAQPAKAGTPNPARFMVTIHARKRVRALHEPPTSNLEPRTSNYEPRTPKAPALQRYYLGTARTR